MIYDDRGWRRSRFGVNVSLADGLRLGSNDLFAQLVAVIHPRLVKPPIKAAQLVGVEAEGRPYFPTLLG